MDRLTETAGTDTAPARPFVKWVGGKSRLLSQIEPLLPSALRDTDGATYVEPFAGGGAMLFYMLQRFPGIARAVINDINPDLIGCYRTVRERPEALLALLSDLEAQYFALPGEEERKAFYLLKRDLYNRNEGDETARSALFIFLNKTCFNGLYRVNRSGAFNVPFGRYKSPKICDPETILADHHLLQRVTLLSGDFAETLRYARGSRYAFFYFDPPYRPLSDTSSFESYSKEGFGDEGQVRLKEFCDLVTRSGFDYALSNSDGKPEEGREKSFFEELYRSYHIHRVFAPRSINADPRGRGKLSEILVTNYDTAEAHHKRRPEAVTMEPSRTPCQAAIAEE